MTPRRPVLYKDEVLDRLSERANVAQFVSFGPDLKPRFSRVQTFAQNHRFVDGRAAILALLTSAADSLVNIRSFRPERPEGGEFIFGLQNPEQIIGHINRLASGGYYTIVNETVDVNDGGVSGVLLGNVIEFAPGETPRCVEGADFVSLPRNKGLALLRTVYGFKPALNYPSDVRVEFSIHPKKRGYADDHTIIWEIEQSEALRFRPATRWPNAFSRMIGDKAFGLLVSYLFGLRVPKTLVIPRKIAPFTIGQPTRQETKWIRTCPREPRPGLFTTVRGYTDPFSLLAKEDPTGEQIASLLVQDEVRPSYSGALLTGRDGVPIIEGVSGAGDLLMLGKVAPRNLPKSVGQSVRSVHEHAHRTFGSVRIEWVHDGDNLWIVQLQQEVAISEGYTIVPGRPVRSHVFRTADGISKLRELVSRIAGRNEGVVVLGKIGLTSHVCDILRRERIPSRITESEPDSETRAIGEHHAATEPTTVSSGVTD